MAKNMKELLEILHANKEDEEEKPTKPTKKEKKTPTLKRNKKYKLSDSPDDVIDESSISLPGRVYIGWVNTKYFNYRRPIIISSNKKLVKYYLKDNRGLEPDMYEITEEELSEQDLSVRYWDQCVTDFYGYYIPNIDAEMIQYYSMDVDDRLQDARRSLCKVISIAFGAESIPKEETDSLVKALDILGKFATDDDIYDDLCKADVCNNSILYEPMEEYLEQLRIYRDMQEQRRRWQYQLYKDEDFVMHPGGALKK